MPVIEIALQLQSVLEGLGGETLSQKIARPMTIAENEADVTDLEAVLERIRAQADLENLRITQHAQQEMVEEGITLDEVLEAIATGQILENYPEHRRGACCLLNGLAQDGRPLHIVCTTARPVVIIITVYEPKPPKWITPVHRR